MQDCSNSIANALELLQSALSCQYPPGLLQCAVQAATQGRVLVLEGIEKAERNVLPILNNLLENREMQLDDGRFLMAAHRYDKLLQVISHILLPQGIFIWVR